MKPFKKKTPAGRSGGFGKKFRSAPFKKRGFGDRDARGGGRGFGGPDPQMFEATCAECGNRAEVPFRPTGGKPVLCRDCFRKEDGGSRDRSDRGARGGRDGYVVRPKFAEKRPFDRAPKGDGAVERRLDEMSAKLDRIIKELAALKDGEF